MPRILFTYRVHVRVSLEEPWQQLRITPWTNKEVAIKDAVRWLTPHATGARARVMQQEVLIFELRKGQKWVELLYVLIPRAGTFDRRAPTQGKKAEKSKSFLAYRKENPMPRKGRTTFWDK